MEPGLQKIHEALNAAGIEKGDASSASAVERIQALQAERDGLRSDRGTLAQGLRRIAGTAHGATENPLVTLAQNTIDQYEKNARARRTR